jgi:hypothetical protein
MAVVTKDITIETEPSYGASRTGTQTKLHTINMTLGLQSNKEYVEDTTNTPKGYDRITLGPNVVTGTWDGFGSPRNIHYAVEWVNGVAGVSAASGTSGALMTYIQNTDGRMLSRTVNIDRQNSQEKFSGVAASSLTMKAANSSMELSLDLIGQSRLPGISVAYTMGETVLPYSYGDIAITWNVGASFASAGNSTLFASEWELTYENGLEGANLSGSYDINRVDPKIPMLSGKYKVFHEYGAHADMAQGSTQFALRFQATLPNAKGNIAGATPYFLRIDIPAVQADVAVKNYKVGEVCVEEVSWKAEFDPGTSALWTVTQVVGISNF